jgi:glycosyltransferase involved in cell wall biosynthesis
MSDGDRQCSSHFRAPVAIGTAVRVRIDWHGDFLGDGSLTRVNRNLARAVAARGDVAIVPYGEPSDEVAAAAGVAPHRPGDRPDDLPRIVLRHRWPPRFMNPDGARYVHIQPWEFGSPPRDWVDQLAARADDVWCYSNHVRDGYVAAGIAAERAHVVPLGFDPAIYHPGVAPIPTDNAQACIFLFVGSLVDRKNVAQLVAAYTAAFAPSDPVALLIKHDSLGMYGDARMAETLRGYQERSDVPPIRFIESYVTDDQMARFYRTATALVQPYRGEGFGLPALEAMACGIPVVVTGGGSTDDFVDERVGYVIPAARVALGSRIGDFELAGEGWWLDPSTEALVAILRRIAAGRDEARAKGSAAAARAHGSWTWAHAAQQLVGRLNDLLVAEPRPRSAAYRDELAAYAWWGFSNDGADGMLVELFSRLGVEAPLIVEIGVEPDEDRRRTFFTERFGWRGVRVAPDTATAAQLREHGVANEFDLLSIDAQGDGSWEVPAGFRPRVVAVRLDPTRANEPHLAAFADRFGYALLAMGPDAREAIFLRRDLLAAAGFPPCPR